MTTTETVRLSAFLARCGVASRRKSDEIIASGTVKVNNTIVVHPYYKINPDKDRVTIGNRKLELSRRYVYIALYKPAGYLSDLADKKNRKLARTLLEEEERLFPVGRLDYSSEGLMLFTNDGAFANRVMHPRFEVEKEYLVKLKGRVSTDTLKNVLKGVLIEGELYRFDEIEPVRAEKVNTWYRVVVHEGKNRMIRKVADAIAHPVLSLKRVRIGPVRLGALGPAQYRLLTEREVLFFLKARSAL
jgi:23S rRNA pseudouridine2605 synthase